MEVKTKVEMIIDLYGLILTKSNSPNEGSAEISNLTMKKGSSRYLI